MVVAVAVVLNTSNGRDKACERVRVVLIGESFRAAGAGQNSRAVGGDHALDLQLAASQSHLKLLEVLSTTLAIELVLATYPVQVCTSVMDPTYISEKKLITRACRSNIDILSDAYRVYRPVISTRVQASLEKGNESSLRQSFSAVFSGNDEWLSRHAEFDAVFISRFDIHFYEPEKVAARLMQLRSTRSVVAPFRIGNHFPSTLPCPHLCKAESPRRPRVSDAFFWVPSERFKLLHSDPTPFQWQRGHCVSAALEACDRIEYIESYFSDSNPSKCRNTIYFMATHQVSSTYGPGTLAMIQDKHQSEKCGPKAGIFDEFPLTSCAGNLPRAPKLPPRHEPPPGAGRRRPGIMEWLQHAALG